MTSNKQLCCLQCVCQLAVATWQVVHGQHSGKTAAFVRACAAYCFITVPSLTSSATRLRLYLLSGNVALLNNCLGQGECCFILLVNHYLLHVFSPDLRFFNAFNARGKGVCKNIFFKSLLILVSRKKIIE